MADLKEALAGARTPVQAFVLLRTWFEDVGLGELESHLARRGIPVARLEARVPPARASLTDWLADQRDEWSDDDVSLAAAAGVLKGLDATLSPIGPPVRGFGGRRWYVRRRAAPWLGREVTWQGSQSRSVDLLAPRNLTVPADPVGGITIVPVAARDWLGRARWADAVGAAAPATVLIWPLAPSRSYDVLPHDGAAFVSVRGLRGLEVEIGELLDVAAEVRATVAVLPELVCSEAALATLRDALAERRLPDLLLLVVGLAHVPGDGSGPDVNEAVLLEGRTGREIHRHRKLSRFEGHGVSERLELGRELTVLEAPFGNLCAVICMDLFNAHVADVLEQTHASLVLAPSLSDKVSAHEAAARRLQVRNRMATFCANRSLDGRTTDGAASFASFCGGLLRLGADASCLIVTAP